MTKQVSRKRKYHKDSNLLNEFLVDFHTFTKKWRTRKIAEALGITRQTAYYHANKDKKKGGE